MIPAFTRHSSQDANIRSLFAAGEQGVWYDPSDMSTMFQGRLGGTPVTAVEQPVGLMLDKSKGMAMGQELVTNGDFSNGTTSWTNTNSSTLTVTNNELKSVATTTGDNGVKQNITTVVGNTYLVSVVAKADSSNSVNNSARLDANTGGAVAAVNGKGTYQTLSVIFTATSTTTTIALQAASTTAWGGIGAIAYFKNVSAKLIVGNYAIASADANRPTLSARYNLLLATETLSTQNVTTVATNYTLSFTGTGSIDLSGTATGTYTAGTNTIACTAGTLTLTVTGSVTQADLRVSNHGTNLPAYQRVTTSTDYDTVGFPKYLSFNGTSSAMNTGNIDFSGGDKMTVHAGVRKTSDATGGNLLELSSLWSSKIGTFSLQAPEYMPQSKYFGYCSRGTAVLGTGAYTTDANYAAPISVVATGTSSISGDSMILRLNTSQVASSSADQGAGNFGNYPLYIGARNNSVSWFPGHIYSLIIRAAQSTAAQIANAETYVNTKCGKLY